MSRLWNKPHLCVFLGEDRLVVGQVDSGRRGMVKHGETLSLVPGQSVVMALEAWLDEHPAEGMQLDISLGVPHVRYLLLPWDEKLAQNEFRLVLARALFARQFQQPVEIQDVRFASGAFGRPLLAAFVDTALVQTLEALAARHGAKVRLLEPLLASVWNRFHSQLLEAGTLLLAEPTRLLRVRYEHGVIMEVQLRPCIPEEASEQLQAFAADAAVRVFAPALPALADTLPTAWLGLKGGGGAPVTGDLAYAFCGVL